MFQLLAEFSSPRKFIVALGKRSTLLFLHSSAFLAAEQVVFFFKFVQTFEKNKEKNQEPLREKTARGNDEPNLKFY